MLLFGNMYLPNAHHRMLCNGEFHVQPRLSKIHRQILLVGMAYPTEIHQQWNSNYCPLLKAIISDDPFVAMTFPALDQFTYISINTNKPTQYSDSVKRDF